MRYVLGTLAALCVATSVCYAEEVTITLTDADQTQLFADDGMMDQCIHGNGGGGSRCVRIQQLILIRIQEAVRKKMQPQIQLPEPSKQPSQLPEPPKQEPPK